MLDWLLNVHSVLNMLYVLNVLDVLCVLNVLNVLKDASSACWALFPYCGYKTNVNAQNMHRKCALYAPYLHHICAVYVYTTL